MKVPALFNPDWLNKRDRRGHRRSDTIKVLAKAIIHDFLTFNVPHMAASIAFWGLFSMFPMVLAIVIITGDFVSYDSFIERVGKSVPVSQDFITDTLTDVSNDWPYTGDGRRHRTWLGLPFRIRCHPQGNQCRLGHLQTPIVSAGKGYRLLSHARIVDDIHTVPFDYPNNRVLPQHGGNGLLRPVGRDLAAPWLGPAATSDLRRLQLPLPLHPQHPSPVGRTSGPPRC